jgi:hypothetical protein
MRPPLFILLPRWSARKPAISLTRVTEPASTKSHLWIRFCTAHHELVEQFQRLWTSDPRDGDGGDDARVPCLVQKEETVGFGSERMPLEGFMAAAIGGPPSGWRRRRWWWSRGGRRSASVAGRLGRALKQQKPRSRARLQPGGLGAPDLRGFSPYNGVCS